jgi:hypothetical protein
MKNTAMNTPNFKNRTFQLWAYRVSHGSLLIRSPQSSEEKMNVDVICAGVEYLAVPRFFRGLEIATPMPEEMRSLEEKLGRKLTSASVHILVSSMQRFPIVAASLKLEENEQDIFESPFE